MTSTGREIEAAVLRHIAMENQHDLEGTMSTVAAGGAGYSNFDIVCAWIQAVSEFPVRVSHRIEIRRSGNNGRA